MDMKFSKWFLEYADYGFEVKKPEKNKEDKKKRIKNKESSDEEVKKIKNKKTEVIIPKTQKMFDDDQIILKFD